LFVSIISGDAIRLMTSSNLVTRLPHRQISWPGADRNDRRVDRAAVGFGGAQPPRQLMAIHVRHVDVGEHGVPRLAAAWPLLGRSGHDATAAGVLTGR